MGQSKEAASTFVIFPDGHTPTQQGDYTLLAHKRRSECDVFSGIFRQQGNGTVGRESGESASATCVGGQMTGAVSSVRKAGTRTGSNWVPAPARISSRASPRGSGAR